MKEQQEREISDLLTHIYQQSDTELEGDQPRRTLNVYIEMDEEENEEETTPTVESTLDEDNIPLPTE